MLGVSRYVTAMGSGTNLFLLSAVVVGFLSLNKRFRAAGFVTAALGSGLLICQSLKDLFVRGRPDVVPKLTHFDTKSFPSGNSMGSALVYLTLGSIISRQSRNWVRNFTFSP
jgi:undecaprenyl-diphosphatase